MYRIFSLVIILAGIIILTSCQKETSEKVETTSASIVVIDSVLSDDSLMIHYEVHGDGDNALIFIHCWSCDRSYWDEQIDVFSKTYKVVTVDLGGHGESSLGREDWTMASFGVDVASVVDKLSLKSVILVGHAMGGPVAIEAARLLPDRVSAIVGVDVFQNLKRSFVRYQVDEFVKSFEADFVTNTKEFVKNTFPKTADSNLVNRLANDMSSAPPEVGINAIRNTLAYNYYDGLKEVRIPVRSINSDRHPTNEDDNENIAESFKVKLMRGKGHFLYLEDPETFNKLLQSTISEFWP